MTQVNALLKSELAKLVSREIPMENGLITITYVKCSPNLCEATVGISVLPENVSGTALKLLRQHSSGFCQILKKRLSLKYIPRFNWKIDPTEKHVDEINKLLNEIEK